MVDIDDLVRDDGSSVSRRVFVDRDLHEQELLNLFGRSWLFLAHDTQLPEAGDYLTTFMGEDPVLVIRQTDGSVKAFLNVCSHRGPLLCLAEEGNAKNFTCHYHGWSFGIDGRLLQVPREGADGYHGTLDKDTLGLPEIRVESYKGLYFGTLDDDAPSLLEFLGDFVWYLDSIFDQLPNGVEFIGGTMRIRLRCNWKIAAENIIADTYHVNSAHGASVQICMGDKGIDIGIEEGKVPDEAAANDPQAAGISATVNGHGWNAGLDGQGIYSLFEDAKPWLDYVEGHRQKYIDRLGEPRAWFVGSSIDGGVFPNFLFVPGFTYRIIHPKGPEECEIWMWTVVEKDLPQARKEEMVRFNARMLGTSGMFETDDCANMERIGMTVKGQAVRQGYSHYAMGMGREKPHTDFPGLIDQRISDNCFRGFYRQWAAFMQAKSWADIPLSERQFTEGVNHD